MSGFEIELPSSPDPLGDEAPPDSAPAPPSTTRRLLQSTASSRFTALPGTSPRKRMFALDVGDEITPQTIFVTVEAGQDGNTITKAPAVGSSVRRRLFGSPTPQPSPQRRIRTTTTTVPLRGLTDDEAGPTPRQRRRSSTGRPGTPAAGSAKKKKRSTPTPKATKRSPKKPRGAPGTSSDIDVLQSETPVLTPRRRGRPPKRKSPTGSPDQLDPDQTQTLPRKKGRRRREALGPDDMEKDPLTENNAETESQRNDRDTSANRDGPEELKSDATLDAGLAAGQAEDEGDLWMDDMSDPPVPNDQQGKQGDEGATNFSDPVNAPYSGETIPDLEDQGALWGESDDYAPMMDFDDKSDVDSRHSEQLPDAVHNLDELEDQGPLPGESEDYAPIREQATEQDNRSDAESQRSAPLAESREDLDHTGDPESFTMIGIESMPSFRTNKTVMSSDPAEIGEGTSLFINKTLDSLRQEIAESDEDEVDILVSRDHTPTGSVPEAQMPRKLSSNRRRASQSSVTRTSRNPSRSPGRTESVAGSITDAGAYKHARSPAQYMQRPGADSPGSNADNLAADEDSFSDIPDDVLAAAESQEWRCELGPNQEAAWTATFNNRSSPSYGSSDDHNRGLQGSHITPSHLDRSHTDQDQDASQQSVSHSAQARRASNQTMERDSPPHSLRSRADSNRLLTPDATTSSSTQSPHAEQAVIEDNEHPVVSEDIGSSPPEIMSFVEEVERPTLPVRRNSDTPANRHPEIHVEHVQERHTFAAVLQPNLMGGPRPTLSPVVRIGRTLQNILSDPPSPSGASSVLGSPFKGSVRNSSPLDGMTGDEALQNGALSDAVPQIQSTEAAPHPPDPAGQSPRKSWALSFAPLSQIKNLVTQGTSMFTSPQINVSQLIDDPFGPSSPTLEKSLDSTRNSAFMDRIKQASREGTRPSSRVSGRTAVGDDTDTQPAVNQTSAQRADVRGSDRTSVSLSNDTNALQHVQQQHADISVGYDGAYDEDADELAEDTPMKGLKRQRVDAHPSDETILQEPDNAQAAQDGAFVVEGPQRRDEGFSASTIQHQELHSCTDSDEDMTRMDDAPADDADDEDIWAIEADRTASSPQFAASQHDTSNLFRKSELSVDWGTQSINNQPLARQGRSPAFLSRRSIRDLPPEDLEDYSLVDLHSGTSAHPSTKKATPEMPGQSKKVDLSDFFSSSPNFIERQRRAKEASLAKSAAQKVEDKPSQLSYPDLTGHVQNAALSSLNSLPLAPRVTTEPFSPGPGASQDTRPSMARSTSSATPEQARHRVPGQKMTPRRAQNDAALFESWSVSSQAATEHPPTSEAPSTPQAVTPLDRESSSFETPGLRTLPGRAASPSKSCLRSPLKPKTPGRVVEFTSSTMSDTVPLQLRHDSQNKAPVALTSAFLPLSSTFAGKENQTILPNNASSHLSPQHKYLQQQVQQQEKTLDSPLSQTRWSKKHWLFLEELWQEYQQNPLEFQLRHSNAIMASPRQRPSSSLLGKVVTSQGESIELRQPHLDVVDAFKKEVGGWNEEMLAKRLFALLVGTERRRLGLVPSRR